MEIGRVKTTAVGVVGVCAVLLASAPLRAQTEQRPATGSPIQARLEISALEGVLENAVRYGAQMLNEHVQNSTVPNMVMLTGMARARGFRLDGYGVLFDVEFPSIRRSVMWSMRALQRPDRELLARMRELRQEMQAPGDAPARQALDRDIKDLETLIKASEQQVGPMTTATTSSNPGGAGPIASATASPTMAPGSVGDPKIDLKAIYFNDIANALVAAILDHGAPIGVGADEWLTVAARESADRGFVPNDPNDTAMTFILRIKGSDLQALQERRLTKDEARKKVEIKQY
jgi:hypothetical protein